jgi:hypothetical protein
MRKLLMLLAVLAVAMLAVAPMGGATIHPIVESFDCAQASFDVAEVPGQITSDFAALNNANENAYSSFKLNGTCGAGGH